MFRKWSELRLEIVISILNAFFFLYYNNDDESSIDNVRVTVLTILLFPKRGEREVSVLMRG